MTTPSFDDQRAALAPHYRRQLRDFIARTFFVDPPGDDDDLMGIVDSLGMLQLVQRVEEKLGERVPREDLTPRYFGTLRRISAYMTRAR